MPKVADFILDNRERIIEQFAREAGGYESARGLSHYELITPLQEYLETLATISRRGDRGDPARTRRRLEETHISLRVRLGYNQEDCTREYLLLGRIISSLWEDLQREQRPPPEDIQLLFDELQSAMDQVVTSFSGYSIEERQAEKRILRSLDGIVPRVLASGDLYSGLEPALTTIQEAMRAHGAVLFLVDTDDQRLVAATTTGRLGEIRGTCASLADPTFVSAVADADEPLYLPDARIAGARVGDLFRHSGLRSLIGIRAGTRERLLGVLVLGTTETRSFEPRARRLLETLVAWLTSYLLRAKLLSERHLANEELRASNERFRTLLESTVEGIWGMDAEGRCTFANPACVRLLGYASAEELLGKRMHPLVHHTRAEGTPYPEDECPVSRTLRTGEPADVHEDILWRKDGTSFPAHYRSSPILRNGRLDGAVVTFQDITGRRRAELETSRRARLAALAADIGTALTQPESLRQGLQSCVEILVRHFDAAFVRIWTLDAAGRVLELQASAGMYTHLHGPHGRIRVGELKVGLIAREKKPLLTNDVMHDPVISDHEWARREGMVSFAGYPLIAEGDVVGVLAMFSRRPLTEETLDTLRSVASTIALGIERKRAHEALRESEHRLRLALESSRLGTWDYDLRSGRILWDERTREVFGFVSDVPVDYTTVLAQLHPEDRAWVDAAVQRTIDPVAQPPFSAEYRILRLDGVMRWVSAHGRALRDASGQAVRLVGTILDITERKHAQEAMAFLARASDTLAASLDYAVTPVAVARLAVPILGEWCVVELHEEGGRQRVEVAHADPSRAELAERLRRHPPDGGRLSGSPRGESSARAVVHPELTPDMLAAAARGPEHVAALRELAPRSCLMVPLLARGRHLGTITVFSTAPSGRRYGPDDARLAEALAARAALAVDNARLLRETVHARERLEAILLSMPALVAVCEGPELRYTLLNPKLRALLADRDLLGWPMREAHPELLGQGLIEATGEVYRNGATWSARDVHVRWDRDGDGRLLDEADFDFTLEPLRRPDGSVEAVILFGVDVSEQVRARKRLEALASELRESEARFRTLVESIPQLVWTSRPDGAMDYVNRRWREYTGSGFEEAQVAGWSGIVHPDDLARTLEDWRRALATGEPFGSECRLRRADGAHRWFIVRALPLRDERARIVKWFGTCTDIDDERRAVAAVRLLADASAVLASSLDYSVTVGNVARVTVPELADWCAIHLREDDGSVRLLAVYHHDESKAGILRELHRRFPRPVSAEHGFPRVLRTGEPELLPNVTDELLQRMAEGPEHLALLRQLGTVSSMVVPLALGGRTLGAIGFGSSDSKRHYGPQDLLVAEEVARRAAVAIENARLFQIAREERQRVEEANRVKDEFLATVSHELRTPLTAMLGWVQMLRSGRLPPERHQRAVETIERNARAQAQLVDDLLDVSRIMSGKLRLDVTTVQLDDVVRAAVESVMPAADAKGLEVRTTLEDCGPVLGDPNRLQQVVWNLLTNAVKFTPRGGRVEVDLRHEGSSTVLVVRDTGQGIPPDFLPHLFERFRQAESGTTRRYGGLGLGLSIVRHLVEMHGGTIEAYSGGEGKGAAFTVRIPISPVRAQPVPALTRKDATLELECPPEIQGIHVLLVDDEPDVRELVSAMLERCGVRVTLAASVAEAMEALHREPPDLLISDIGMPGEDGYSLIRKVRGLPREAGGWVQAIAMTAYARMEDRTRALLAGFQMHLPKPIAPEELLAVVATLTARARG